MDAQLSPTTGDYTGLRIDTLANAVYVRLSTPLGSWWADASLGSRLHELTREKDLARVQRLAKQYAEQALAPLLADGRARSITVEAGRPGNGLLLLIIQIEDAAGRQRRFQHPVRVA